MESLSSKNKNVKYSLYIIDVFTKIAWVKPLKGKKDKTIANALIEIVNESIRKANFGLIKKKNFTIDLFKNGLAIMIL